jgi:hydroxyacylglutathione hydrolase
VTDNAYPFVASRDTNTGTTSFPQPVFPANDPASIAWFWVRYWLWFLALLPWMVIRQIGVSAYQLFGALATWNRRVTLIPDELELQHMTSLGSIIVTTLFGERFVCSRYRDILIDPGPGFGRRILRRWLESGDRVEAIVATHYHEEHIGNAAFASGLTGAPVWGTATTLAAVAVPENVSAPRRLLMGQPDPDNTSPVQTLREQLCTQRARFRVLSSGGHCKGHASLYDPERRILFAGDSFLDTIFTAPNRDVSAAEWVATLRMYRSIDVATMVGSHGLVFTSDPSIRRHPMVVRHRDPNAMIARKLDFTLWTTGVVAEGERRGLPYSVIEATLFPWERPWSWRNWFADESWRLFTVGEFSRTHFVRSLSKTPQRVPHRFPGLERFRAAVVGAIAQRREILRVHVLALHPANVLTILAGVAASLGAIAVVSQAARLPVSWWRSFIAVPELLHIGRFDLLASAFAWLTLVWATLGGGVTRRMSLAIQGAEPESLWDSILFCCRPALAFPSALASVCLFLILSSPLSLLLLIPVLPLWLYAGFLYGALVTARVGLRKGLMTAHARIRRGADAFRRQLRLIGSFAISTLFVYVTAAITATLAWRLFAALTMPELGKCVAGAICVYALGYTTSNLKSLQIVLYLSLGDR